MKNMEPLEEELIMPQQRRKSRTKAALKAQNDKATKRSKAEMTETTTTKPQNSARRKKARDRKQNVAMKKVYVVGHSGPEHNAIRSIHRTREGVLKAWNKLRLELLQEAKSSLEKDGWWKEMMQEMVKNLSCEDPDKIDNYPYETPYIRGYEVEE